MEEGVTGVTRIDIVQTEIGTRKRDSVQGTCVTVTTHGPSGTPGYHHCTKGSHKSALGGVLRFSTQTSWGETSISLTPTVCDWSNEFR